MITLDTTTGRIINPGEPVSKTAVRFDPNTQRYDSATKQVLPRSPEVPHLVDRLAKAEARIAALEAALGIRAR